MTSTSEFSTDQVFNSNQELVEWAQNVARSLGYVLVTKRSKKKNGYLSKIILMCDRGGVYRSSDRGDKETASKKIDCKFELVGKYYKIKNFWMLTVKYPEHNHEPALYMEGHPYARRLTDHEFSLVETMTSQNLKARDILSTLKNLTDHELILHFNANEPIPLQSVDVFWRKLDLEPSIPVEDVDLDFDNEVQNIKKSFEKQSPFGKFNFLKKFKAIYESKETLVGEPEYHKDNRGRPSLKKTKKLHLPTHNPPNTSSVVGSELFDLNKEPARHSMYVNQTSYPNQSYYADPFMSETQTHNPDPYMYTTQPYYADPFMSETQTHNPDPYMCTTQPYYVDPDMKDPDFLIQQGLRDFIPYITQVHNVEGDGNCGFRAIAACLGGHQDSWPKIRMDLLDELSVHNEAYTLMFHKEGVQLLQYILNHFKKGQAPRQHWMEMPDTGLLIASRYNVVVIFLSKEGETTCLPLFSSPPKSQPHHICVISRFHGIHFVRLELQGDFPIPPTHPQWSSYAFDRTWENPYLHRQNVYNQLKFPNRNSGCVKTHINIED